MEVSDVYRYSSSRLELLRELDSMLDFAKSTIQLELVIYLGQKNKGIRPREAAKDLRIKVKSVYDALTKLIGKGLVARSSTGLYELTPEGRAFVNKLYALFSDPHTRQSYFSTSRMTAPRVSLGTLTVTKNVLFYKYVYDSMMALGLSPKKELSLKELARVVGVSETTLAGYLDVVTAKRGQTGLFKRIVRSKGKGKSEVFYRLTEFGLQELSRFSEYRRIKNNKLLLFMLSLTRSLSLNEAVGKLTTISGIVAAGSVIAYALSFSELFIASFGILTVVSLLSSLLLISSRW